MVENKERIIFKYNQLLETMINYKAHMKVADELDLKYAQIYVNLQRNYAT